MPRKRALIGIDVGTSGTKVLPTLGPDSGHVSEPGVGLVFASECLLASELLVVAPNVSLLDLAAMAQIPAHQLRDLDARLAAALAGDR